MHILWKNTETTCGKACVDVAGFRQVLGKPKPVEVRIQLDHSDVGHIYVSQDRFALEARSEQIVLTHRQIQEIVDYAREHGRSSDEAGFQRVRIQEPDSLIMAYIGGIVAHGARVAETADLDWYGVFVESASQALGLDL